MVMNFGAPATKNDSSDRLRLRLAVLAVLVVACFVALFSRLWFLQVLASEDFLQLAKENRVRRVYSEPARGRILDRNHDVLVGNRYSLAVTVDRQVIDGRRERRRTLRRLSTLLDVGERELKSGLDDVTVSPYKPVPVAYDVDPDDATRILENLENFRGVAIETLPVREYPQVEILAHVLGYTGEISEDDLKNPFFKDARPRYRPGDIVGKTGVEYTYDHFLRGTPEIRKVVVNSAGEIIADQLIQKEGPGKDVVLSIDSRIQRIAEKSLRDGILAARARYEAPDGAAVVMDPSNGQVIAMASWPTYNPEILADGFSFKDQDLLGGATPNINTDDALVNRAIQSGIPPGSTFKVATAGAAIATGAFDPYESLDCDPVFEYRDVPFNNWTSTDFGFVGLAESLEISCDTFYYQLAAEMENRWGVGTDTGDGSERFQDYLRKAGFGHETGIDLPGESDGRVPDAEWCDYIARETDGAICPEGWLPGYTVNMSIGQGDLIVSPIQMAVTYSALLNGGDVLEPRVAMGVGRPDPDSDQEKILKEITTEKATNLGLDPAAYSLMRTGLEDVVSGDDGTATSAFTGFPLDRVPVGGKTGTAQIGSVDSGKNFAWFVAYAPADDPDYVIAVYIEKAGHGGESAAPVARQIFEGIYRIDKETDVNLGVDASG